MEQNPNGQLASKVGDTWANSIPVSNTIDQPLYEQI